MTMNQLVGVEDVSALLEELESRLPKSSNVFNMAKFYSKFSSEMKFYILQEERNKFADVWIFVIYQRKDFGQDISISAPTNPFKVFSPLQIQQAFHESNLIDWNKAYHFTTLDRDISRPFYELSVNIKGNATLVIPDYFYYLEREAAASLIIDKIDNNGEIGDDDIQVKSLASPTGVDFIKKTWKHAAPDCDDYLTNMLQRNESRGVFLNDEIVSGIVLNGTGFLAMLHTLPNVRRRGFGKLCMKDLIRSLGQSGFIPCCSVDIKNHTSQAFQISVGLKKSHIVDYILYCPENFD